MNYSEPLINQINIFFKSFGAGVLIALIYEAVALTRIAFGDKKWVFIFFDTVFVIAACFVSFFFMVLYNSGQVRLNLMIGELAGGAAFHYALGRYLLLYSEKIVRKLKAFLTRLFMPLIRFIRKIFSLAYKKLNCFTQKTKNAKIFQKNIKNISNIRKILLKNKNKSV